MAMDTQTSIGTPEPVLSVANPHFSDSVNRNIIRSEIEGGVYLRDLSPGSVLSIQTMNRVYEMVVLGDGAALISGHPEFCPEPTEVQIQGSTWGGSMLKMRFVGRGMHLEFEHSLHRRIITSRIVDIRAH
jgi:hypothetical protein